MNKAVDVDSFYLYNKEEISREVNLSVVNATITYKCFYFSNFLIKYKKYTFIEVQRSSDVTKLIKG